jgi:hypothetical protein
VSETRKLPIPASTPVVAWAPAAGNDGDAWSRGLAHGFQARMILHWITNQAITTAALELLVKYSNKPG